MHPFPFSTVEQQDFLTTKTFPPCVAPWIPRKSLFFFFLSLERKELQGILMVTPLSPILLVFFLILRLPVIFNITATYRRIALSPPIKMLFLFPGFSS